MKILLLFLFIIGQSCFAQTHSKTDYVLLDTRSNADINYAGIDSISSYGSGLLLLDSVFNTIPGEFTIYRFLTYHKGVLSQDGDVEELNNMLILKISKENVIVDGYHYFLQYPEMPSECELYRITKHKKLKEGTKINALKFKRVFKEGPFQICGSKNEFYRSSSKLHLTSVGY